MRSLFLILISLNIIFTASTGNWMVLAASIVAFVMVAPPANITPGPPPKTRLVPLRSAEEEYAEWERCLRVEYMAGDIDVWTFEEEIWRHLLLMDGVKETLREIDLPSRDQAYLVCGCEWCMKQARPKPDNLEEVQWG